MNLLSGLQNLLWFALYLATSLILLGVFVRIYLWMTPYDDIKDIHDGKTAPAVALGGAMLGFTFPLLMASYLHAGLIGFICWAIISGAVQLLVFWAMYRFLPRVIETNNLAGAICFACVAVCAGLLNAASFIP